TKACVAGFVLPPGAYLRHLHHSDGSSSQGKFNLSDLFSTRNGFRAGSLGPSQIKKTTRTL
ncbi:hypothetical protein L7H84_29895, partial [Klebsiella pneumoniae]|uniref:hypothetical protein n=1 Tax=Acinetobacter baumannii TaxID=470 RepID=UPI002870AD8F